MRDWKPYSSVARDGEKTVRCSKGNHSVYYGNALISFKPSKLIWCKDCKNTYYEVKPTLFNQDTQEVYEMDTNPVNNKTNPKEGSTMKCDKNPLNNLKPMSEKPTDEELITWLITKGNDRYAGYGGRMMDSISRQAKENGWLSPKQKAVVLAHYLQDVAHLNPFTKKTWGHDWQKGICKWCEISKEDFAKKSVKDTTQMLAADNCYCAKLDGYVCENCIERDWVFLVQENPNIKLVGAKSKEESPAKMQESSDQDPWEKLIWPVELEMIKNDEHGRIYVTCTRCNGCGLHSYNMRDGSMCWGCQGTGAMLDPLMTDKQIKFIRELFKSVRDKMTLDEQEELIDIMKGAISKTKRVNKFWASQTIDNLKSLQTERGAS